MTKLYGVKNCHRYNERKGCELKNSEENLLEKPKKVKTIALPVIAHVQIPTEVTITSFCKDFALEKRAIKE